jgi:TPR repeat protein
MVKVLEDEYASQSEYHREAAPGDADVPPRLAWDYFNGRSVSRAFEMAFSLLRQLEAKSPDWARFNVAKMKFPEEDDFFSRMTFGSL